MSGERTSQIGLQTFNFLRSRSTSSTPPTNIQLLTELANLSDTNDFERADTHG